MSQKFREINGDTMKHQRNNSIDMVEKGNDLNTRKAALTPLEFRVTQQRETERPYSNRYNKHWEAGTYHCIVCDAELFRSETKFESKSGWPAFYNVVDPQRVKLTPDLSHIGANLLLLIAKPDLARTEVSCANCNAHLGHLFKDGPKPTGLRYCINSASLNFRPTGSEIVVDGMLVSLIENGSSAATIASPPPIPIQEYVCKPENMCSRQQAHPSSTATTPNSMSSNLISGGKSARDNFFNSSENHCNSLPPMGALCLNNQSCQRVPRKPINADVLRPSVISNGAENKISSVKTQNTAIPSGVENVVNFPTKMTTQTVIPKSAEIHASIIPTARNITPMTNGNSGCPTNNVNGTQNDLAVTPVSSNSRYPTSKGASLTAARINFFQKISTPQDRMNQPPSRWAATYNSRWSSDKPTTPPDISTHESPISNRFPSSCSSGSLSRMSQAPVKESVLPPLLPRRSSSSSFFGKADSTAIPVEQVSTPPKSTTLRETTL